MNKITLVELKAMAQSAKGSIRKVYLHWSAGHYGQFFPDYHINIDHDGSIYVSVDDLTTHLNHTYLRNSGAIGVALASCYNAATNDLGLEPPTNQQIESAAQVIAVLCTVLGLTANISTVLTHAEAANNLDDEDPGYEANGCPNGIYGPNPNPDGSQGGDCERWDLWILKDGDAPWSGGNTLRGKAIYYQNNGF